MTVLQYHRQLFHRSIFVMVLALIFLCAVLALMWIFLEDAFFQIPLGVIAWFALRIFWFHLTEVWKLRWLIAAYRINANLFRHRKP